MHFTEGHIHELLKEWPRLRRRPTRIPGRAIVVGIIRFEVAPTGKPIITDEYRIRLEFALTPTSNLPQALEEDGRITRDDDHHINPLGDMCLGSPLRILNVLGLSPTLTHFVTACVVPFLYAASWRERGHPGYPFDELPHGAPGLVADYERMFHVSGRDSVVSALGLLALRKRVANKRPCPCGCGRRLASCGTRLHLAPFRALAARRFYDAQSASIAKQLPNPQEPKQPCSPSKRSLRFAKAKSLLAVRPLIQLSN